MAGEQLQFHSWIPMSSDVFPRIHVGAGANSKHEEGLGVVASLTADAIWRGRAKIPTTLPSGAAKLKLWALASASSGAAKVNPKWASVAAEADPSSASLTAETVQTLTWVDSGDIDVYKELLIPLDAVTIGADQMIVMDLTFETSGWTLASASTWFPWIIWE